jgi:glycosyltransferase involved in cell wall biosynthesis
MTSLDRRCRVAVVTGLPTPYREPVFSELSRRDSIDLRVFYATEGHRDVGWIGQNQQRDYDHCFLRNAMPEWGRRLPFIGYATLGLTAELRQFDPDYLLVYGYNQLSQWLAFAYADRRRIPFALRSDSNALLDTRSDWKSHLRRRLVRSIVARAHAVLPVGSINKLFWEKLGATDRQIFMAPYAVENERISRLASHAIRDPLGPVRLIYVGRLLPRKGVDILVSAFNQLVGTKDVQLTIVGDGPQRTELMNMQTKAARSRTIWKGKLSNPQAMESLGQADLFVLPSRYEPWGLVVNEAMAAGLPVIAHRHVGAAIDLIVSESTGWTLEDHSVDTMLHLLQQAVADRERLKEMGQRAQDQITAWSIQSTVDGMVAAIQDACPTMLPTKLERSPRREATHA